MQGDGPRLSSRPWNNEYDGFAKSFFAKKERFQLLIRVFDIAPYNMEGALLPEYESGSLSGMGGSQFRTKWLSANEILINEYHYGGNDMITDTETVISDLNINSLLDLPILRSVLNFSSF